MFVIRCSLYDDRYTMIVLLYRMVEGNEVDRKELVLSWVGGLGGRVREEEEGWYVM